MKHATFAVKALCGVSAAAMTIAAGIGMAYIMFTLTATL